MVSFPLARCFAIFSVAIFVGSASAERSSYVRFDVSPVVIAKATAQPSDLYVPDGYRLVQFNFDISSLIDTPTDSQPHEFLYRIDCGSYDVRVADYSPRTRLADTTVGGVQVEQSDEKVDNFGVGVKGSYSGLIHGDGAYDHARKTTNKSKYESITRQEIVYASGTVERGRGVYFKLRSTPQHVLDGQKRFSVTLRVPNAWRAELVDVRMSALESIRPFPTMPKETVVTSQARFCVAVVDEKDEAMQRMAWQLGEAEQSLRSMAARHAATIRERSVPTIFHHVAVALDVIEPRISDDWLSRTLFGNIDPYFDKQIRQLPVDVKVTVLDYLEAKARFASFVKPNLEMSQEARSELAAN